jgi:hypothetical protein
MKKSTGEFKGEMFVAQWVIPVADTGLGGGGGGGGSLDQ